MLDVLTARCSNVNGQTICLHVDDFLYAGSEEFLDNVIEKLCRIFSIGSRQNENITFTGVNITKSGHGVIKLSQSSNSSSVKTLEIPEIVKKNREFFSDSFQSATFSKILCTFEGLLNAARVSRMNHSKVGESCESFFGTLKDYPLLYFG